MERKFFDKDKVRVIRKALDFWYKFLKNRVSLKRFINDCSIIKTEKDFVIIYKTKSKRQRWL